MSRKGKRRISFQVLILETQNFPGLDSKMEAQGDLILYQPLRDWCCQEQGPSAEGCLGISGVLQGSWSCVHNLYSSLVAPTLLGFTGNSCHHHVRLCLHYAYSTWERRKLHLIQIQGNSFLKSDFGLEDSKFSLFERLTHFCHLCI